MNRILLDDMERIHAAIQPRAQGRLTDATVLITGCAGFLGFYLTQYLVRNAASLGIRKVIGLDAFLLDKPAWLVELARQSNGVFDVQKFDIARDPLDTVRDAAEARYLIHAASIASPSFYRRFPLETIDANIWGLRNILDFYRGSKTLAGLLFFSSSEIYGDPPREAIPTDESYRGNVACIGPRACYDE